VDDYENDYDYVTARTTGGMPRRNDYRVGLIVPSSNVTMETEIPAMLRSRPAVYDEGFTFHASRMRMNEVTPEELRRMDEQSERCAIELSDARCDVLAYACLIGIMAQGAGYHEESEATLRAAAADNGGDAPVVTSAGALVRAFETLGADRVAVITPYLQELTDTVVDYFEAGGVSVVDAISLECPDNLEVARLDPADLLDHVRELDHADAGAVVLSSCVQMPSLSSIQAAEDRLGKPVVSASVATTYDILTALDRSPRVEGAGTLLSGRV
jgi:maleate isomerase